jgi:membrane-anchored protein YejM (alkaline phosphatase superfamily)
MGTHGPHFSPRQRVFSQGKQQTEDWMTDFYDDEILDFDRRFQEVVDFLTQNNKLENTIIVLYSDHLRNHRVEGRVPLIFWFPNHTLKGRIQENVQILDIAPTLLEYLQIPKPDWMAGESLISNRNRNCRWILTVGAKPLKIALEGQRKFVQRQGPFGNLTSLGAVICDRHFDLDLTRGLLTLDWIKQHSGGCGDCPIPDRSVVLDFLTGHLQQNGYDTASLRASAAN